MLQQLVPNIFLAAWSGRAEWRAYTSIKLPAEPATGAAVPCLDPGMPTEKAIDRQTAGRQTGKQQEISKTHFGFSLRV